jgi:SAM-dependent methyltransferase
MRLRLPAMAAAQSGGGHAASGNFYPASFGEDRAQSYLSAMADHPEALRDEFEAATREVLACGDCGASPREVLACGDCGASPREMLACGDCGASPREVLACGDCGASPREVLACGDCGASPRVVQLEAGGSVPPQLAALPGFRAFDSHEVFARAAGVQLAEPHRLPLESGSVDAVLVLAVLHHYSGEARRAVYAECLRVLRPGGRLVVGDVVRGSAQDRWLNGFVDAHNPLGHCGDFLEAAQEERLLTGLGFARASSRLHSYAWRFPNGEARHDFMTRLFYLRDGPGGEPLARPALDEALGRILHCDGARWDVPWELLFVRATKKGSVG